MLTIESSFIKTYSIDGIAFDIIEHLANEKFPFRIGNRSCIESPFTRGIGKYKLHERDQRKFKLVINPVVFLDFYGIDSKTIVYTFWDTSVLPLKYVNLLNEARLIIVSSNETKRVFQHSGVIVDIKVIPLGFHPLYYYPLFNKQEEPKFKFGCSGQITSKDNDKKDIQTVIDCFADQFKFNSKVMLSVKITDNSPIPNTYGLHNIELINDLYTDAQMGDWYRSLSCYINISKYESYGKQPNEAMACGIPVISTIHSGLSDYMNDDNVLQISHHTESGYLDDTQYNWYSADKEELKNTMNYCYYNPTKIVGVGLSGYNSVRTNQNIINFLNKFEKTLIPYTTW